MGCHSTWFRRITYSVWFPIFSLQTWFVLWSALDCLLWNPPFCPLLLQGRQAAQTNRKNHLHTSRQEESQYLYSLCNSDLRFSIMLETEFHAAAGWIALLVWSIAREDWNVIARGPALKEWFGLFHSGLIFFSEQNHIMRWTGGLV